MKNMRNILIFHALLIRLLRACNQQKNPVSMGHAGACRRDPQDRCFSPLLAETTRAHRKRHASGSHGNFLTTPGVNGLLLSPEITHKQFSFYLSLSSSSLLQPHGCRQPDVGRLTARMPGRVASPQQGAHRCGTQAGVVLYGAALIYTRWAATEWGRCCVIAAAMAASEARGTLGERRAQGKTASWLRSP
jgi:hypothetical protein